MPERQIPRMPVQRFTVPARKPLGVSELLANVSNYFSELAEDSIKEWGRAEIAEARKAGQLEGSLETVKYRDSGTLTAEAFNEEALKGQLKNLEITNNLVFSKLKISEAGNPESFLEKSNAQIERTVEILKENRFTAPFVSSVENTLRLKQLTYGHEISKEYKGILVDQAKVSTESLVDSLKTEMYGQSANIYSEDNQLASLTWNNFAVAKKALDVQLNTTAGGVPVFNALEKERIAQDFHNSFYIKGIQHYVSDNDITPEEEIALLRGDFTVQVPGTELVVNPLYEIGVEKYDSQIKSFVKQKARERLALDRKIEEQTRNQLKITQSNNGLAMMASIMSGEFDGNIDTINEMVQKGVIDASWGMRGIKRISNIGVGIDDFEVVSEANRMLMEETDITEYLKIAGDKLTNKTFLELTAANDKVANDLTNREIKAFRRQFVKVDPFNPFRGMAESERDFNDIVSVFRQDLANGVTLELAVQKMRETGDFINIANTEIRYKLVEPAIEYTPEGRIDHVKTLGNLDVGRRRGEITEIDYANYLEALRELYKLPIGEN